MRYALILLIATACSRAPRVHPGDLDVSWRGSARGRFVAPLEATHCASSGQVELLAVRGDTGVGVALFLEDSTAVQPVVYPVMSGSLLQETRPGSSIAVRWFAVTSISAFEGITGKVTLSSAGNALSGTLDVTFKALDRPDTLHMSGSFTQVPVAKADTNCRLVRKRNKL
jgi:hypothetical protein